jgi:hypothetical protein
MVQKVAGDKTRLAGVGCANHDDIQPCVEPWGDAVRSPLDRLRKAVGSESGRIVGTDRPAGAGGMQVSLDKSQAALKLRDS